MEQERQLHRSVQYGHYVQICCHWMPNFGCWLLVRIQLIAVCCFVCLLYWNTYIASSESYLLVYDSSGVLLYDYGLNCPTDES